MLELRKIEDSYQRIKSYLKPTRLEESLNLSDEDSKVYLKLENEQAFVKSFKIRGVLSKLTSLTDDEIKNNEITTISSGNQGVSLAYGAKLLGLKSPIIYAPETTPKPKIDKIKYFGAEIVQVGRTFDEANVKADEIIKEKGYIKVDAREDEVGVVGQASIGIEILNAMPDIDAVIVPKGSGGMSIAIASYFKQKKPNVKVYAVEAANSPALTENLRSGVWTRTYDVTTEGEALLQSLIGGCARLTFDNSDVLEDIFLVSDDEAKKAVVEIVKKEKMIVEPDSAVVYAAYKKHSHIFKGKKTALIISGANIDDEVFKNIITEYY